MITNFVGTQYRLANNWYPAINVNEFKNRPIRYLEIGTFHGANLFSVAESYGAHPDSVLHCIDPCENYNDYPEYKNEQPTNYNIFMNNLNNSSDANKRKITVHRGFSNQEVPKFEDEYFDIIYIDGNHEPEYVLEDAVLSFRKLKKNGYMIFDDYGWGGPDLTQAGIDAFVRGYHKRSTKLGIIQTQLFVKKN